MASSSFIIFLLIITLSSPIFLHARESQFFSKVTNKPTTETVVLPADKEQQQTEQPEFVPHNQNGYGMYEQDNTKTKSGVQTHTPATYASEQHLNKDKNGAGAQTETEQFGNEAFYNNGEKYYSDKGQYDDAFYKNGETEKYYTNNKDQNDDNKGEKYYSDKGQYDEAFYNNGEKYYSNKGQNDDESLDFDDSSDANTQNSDKEAGELYYENNSNNGVGTEHYTTESQTQKEDKMGETYYYNADRSSQVGTQLGQTQTENNGFTNELNARYNTYRPTRQGQSRGSNVDRQGMSDTRFLENGRYYYDVNKEQNQYAKQNTYTPSYNTNQYGSRAYQSNEVDGSKNKFYDNSGAEKYEFNTMEEYEKSRQNQYDP